MQVIPFHRLVSQTEWSRGCKGGSSIYLCVLTADMKRLVTLASCCSVFPAGMGGTLELKVKTNSWVDFVGYLVTALRKVTDKDVLLNSSCRVYNRMWETKLNFGKTWELMFLMDKSSNMNHGVVLIINILELKRKTPGLCNLPTTSPISGSSKCQYRGIPRNAWLALLQIKSSMAAKV